MLKDFEYFNDVLNEIEHGAINGEPPRMSGYRLGYIRALIKRAYFYDETLTRNEYDQLEKRADEIYFEVKR